MQLNVNVNKNVINLSQLVPAPQYSYITEAQADARYAKRASNLSDLASVSTARTNLDLATASDAPSLTATGSIALNRLGIISHHNLAPASGTSGNTSIAELSPTNARDGDTAFVYCAIPAVAGQIFELKDNTGTVIATVSSSGTAFTSTMIAFYWGTVSKWICNFQSA